MSDKVVEYGCEYLLHCPICDRHLSFNKFNKDGSSVHGRQTYCRECYGAKHNEYCRTRSARDVKKAWAENNPYERGFQDVKAWREANEERYKYIKRINDAVYSGYLVKPVICPKCKKQTKKNKMYIDLVSEPRPTKETAIFHCSTCHADERIARNVKKENK